MSFGPDERAIIVSVDRLSAGSTDGMSVPANERAIGVSVDRLSAGSTDENSAFQGGSLSRCQLIGFPPAPPTSGGSTGNDYVATMCQLIGFPPAPPTRRQVARQPPLPVSVDRLSAGSTDCSRPG